MKKHLDIHLKFELPEDYDVDIINDELDNKEQWSYILDLITDNEKRESKDTCKFTSVKIY